MASKLISYKHRSQFQALNSNGIEYEFTIQTSVFGLFKKQKKIVRTIPYVSDCKKTYEKWDELIRTGENLR
jgi:hypothetical protein